MSEGIGTRRSWTVASSSRISRVIEQGSYRDEERWPEIHDAMIDAMIRFEKALRPHLSRLKA